MVARPGDPMRGSTSLQCAGTAAVWKGAVRRRPAGGGGSGKARKDRRGEGGCRTICVAGCTQADWRSGSRSGRRLGRREHRRAGCTARSQRGQHGLRGPSVGNRRRAPRELGSGRAEGRAECSDTDRKQEADRERASLTLTGRGERRLRQVERGRTGAEPEKLPHRDTGEGLARAGMHHRLIDEDEENGIPDSGVG